MNIAQALRLFARERAAFAQSFPTEIRGVKLVIRDQRCSINGKCGLRDLAWADRRDRTVNLLLRALSLPENRVVGLLRHELGHLADPWIDRPGAEQRADDIAEVVTGQRIRYDLDNIQTIGPGTYPRPLHLHR